MASNGLLIEDVNTYIMSYCHNYIINSDVIDLYDIKEEYYEDILDEISNPNFRLPVFINKQPALICFVEMLDRIYNNGETFGDGYVWANLCGNGLQRDGARALYQRVFGNYAWVYLVEMGYTGFINKMKEYNTEILSLIRQVE